MIKGVFVAQQFKEIFIKIVAVSCVVLTFL